MSTKKKHRPKRLTEFEYQRRLEARKKRVERQKLEQIRMNREFNFGCLLFIMGMVLFFWLMFFHEEIFLIYFLILAVIFVTLCDKSGIRSFLFQHYPDSFPWADTLKAEYPERSFSMELAGTLSGYLVILMLTVQKLSVIWSVLWIICMGIGFYHILFHHHQYHFDDRSSGTFSVMFLFTPLLFFLSPDFHNHRWTKLFIILLAGGFLLMMILMLICNNSLNIFPALLFGFFVYTGFCMINQYFDFSEPVNYACTVEDKTYHSGKSSSYDIAVTDWKNPDDTVDIEVVRNQYDALEIGDTVTVAVCQGALHMEHYQLK